MTNLALFLSGSGGNALNLLTACRENRVPGRVRNAVSSNPAAMGNARLRREGLPVDVVERKAFASDEAFSAACYDTLLDSDIEVICLCGWLKKLHVPPEWEGRILNIHPGLLPRFGGPGMYGRRVHEAVLAAGERESGCTVHLVDGEYDHGRILAQARVPVLPEDTPESLQARVYAEEMRLYPEALAEFLLSFRP